MSDTSINTIPAIEVDLRKSPGQIFEQLASALPRDAAEQLVRYVTMSLSLKQLNGDAQEQLLARFQIIHFGRILGLMINVVNFNYE